MASSILDKDVFPIPHASFQQFAKKYAEILVSDSTGIDYSCKEVPIDDIKPVGKSTDSLVNKKARVCAWTRFENSIPTGVFYVLPDEELYKTESPIYWITRHIENIYHECRHLNDLFSVFCNTTSEKARFSALLQLVSRNNPGFDGGKNGTGHDLANYSHNVNEMRAEMYAFNHTWLFLSHFLPDASQEDIECILSKLVNDKIYESNGHYCLCYGKSDSIKSWNEMNNLITASLDAAYKVPFVYDIFDSDNLRRDYLARHLKDSVTEDVRIACLQEDDLFEQVRMFATLTLAGMSEEEGMEYARTEQDLYYSLRGIDLSESNIFNTCFPNRAYRAGILNQIQSNSNPNTSSEKVDNIFHIDTFNDLDYI